MNNEPSRKPIFPQIFSNTVRQLLITEKDPLSVYWILGGITLLGMIMRLWKMNEPIAYDEAYTFIYYATKPFKQMLSDYSAPNNHILHTILVSLSYRLLGGHAWIVRLPAFLAGTACIPVGFFTARRIFNANQSLAAASLVALTPWFISYSTNGRGYTLLTLFALLLVNFGALLIQRQSGAALIAYGTTITLGFYTIPIFLYPAAGVSLWVLASYLMEEKTSSGESRRIWLFLATCAAAGVVTFVLYAPVIFFGTGAASIFSNEFVEPRDWQTFTENLGPRAVKMWSSWMLNIAPVVQYLLLGGFVLSVLFFRKASRQRLPLQLCMVIAIAVLLVLQRVAPLPRVWLFLEIFYMLFAGSGLVWLLEMIISRMGNPQTNAAIVSAGILVLVVAVFADKYLTTHTESVLADINKIPEEYAAEYLATHLTSHDKIFSTAPVDIRTAYYLYMSGVSYDVFYQRDHPLKTQNALIVLRTNSEYNTPERVLEFYKLTSEFNLQRAQLVFEYGPLNVFSVPAK